MYKNITNTDNKICNENFLNLLTKNHLRNAYNENFIRAYFQIFVINSINLSSRSSIYRDPNLN